MTVLGLHHISLICANAQRTIDFYVQLLGLRLVKKTVNFDDPSSYHLYFGDQKGTPGSLVTSFEYPQARQGHPGTGGTHHFALQVGDFKGLLKWKRRLVDAGLQVKGPFDQKYFRSINFRDPDGVIVEIATQGPGWTADAGAAFQEIESGDGSRTNEGLPSEVWTETVNSILPEMTLQRRMHHITAISADIKRTHSFYGELLGMDLIKRAFNFESPESAQWYWGVGEGAPGTLITYFEQNPATESRARIGAGQTHHFALAVPDDETQLEWRERLLSAGIEVTRVMDRVYFKSIYTRDPDGHIVELATMGPGFMIDESAEHLGETLKLPPWMESRREEIERRLMPVNV